MPGIIDAEIFTKSSEGSLREARVNFVCFNKRQLEILETLYMSPGYPILLEWGWVPFIDNNFKVNNAGYPILYDFFKNWSSMDSLNNVKVERVNTCENVDLVIKNNVIVVPTLIFYVDSTEVKRLEGDLSFTLKNTREEVQKIIEELNTLPKK